MMDSDNNDVHSRHMLKRPRGQERLPDRVPRKDYSISNSKLGPIDAERLCKPIPVLLKSIPAEWWVRLESYAR